jgi:hypothetical protein
MHISFRIAVNFETFECKLISTLRSDGLSAYSHASLSIY